MSYSVDLATGKGPAGAVEAQAIVEGVTSQRDVVRPALASDIVRRAAEREHWSETYVGAVLDGQLTEGFVNLIYREDDGSPVVVD